MHHGALCFLRLQIFGDMPRLDRLLRFVSANRHFPAYHEQRFLPTTLVTVPAFPKPLFVRFLDALV
jgi:hypothetical protein